MSQLAFLNGVARPINNGESILEFARRHQESIPTLCDDTRLNAAGSCRVCSVDVALTVDGPRKVMASCHTPVSENMYIFTESDRIQSLRRNIVELVLSDHPPDCLTCESNGNCELQDVAGETGVRKIRYAKGKNHLDREKDTSHPYMRMDLSKCINCYRCVRACDEIQGQFVLSVDGRGFDSKIIAGMNDTFGDSDCVSCGACAQTCPTAAISDRFQSKAIEATNVTRTTCSYCGVGCNLEVSTKNDQILSIRAPHDAEVNAGHTCLKGRYAWGFYNHGDRLKTPLIKKNGEFVPASWDEALDLIAAKLTQIKTDHGPDAIAGISSSRCPNEENYLMQKLMRVVIGTNNIDCCARVCHSPTAHGMQMSFGTGAATNSIDDLNVTEFMLVIGANPTAAHPVTGAKLKQKAMKGIPLIVIDPVETELARHASWHLQLRPGTNVALLNMMARFIIEEGLVDQAFIDTRCEAWEDYKEAILSLDINELADITDVDPALVKDAAVAYAKAGSAMSFHGLGVSEHTQGSRAVMGIADLAMMTGNIGRRGVGVNPLRGQNNVQGAADMGCQPHQGAGYLPLENPDNIAYYEEKYGSPVPREIGYKIPEMFNAAIAGDLKAMWILGEDVAQTDPNHTHVMNALTSLDFLVVQEIFLSETAKVADVILPGASFLEKSGTFTNGERRVQRVQAAVSPRHDSKADGQIIVDIMNKLGYAQPDYAPDTMLEEISQVVPFFAGIRWDRLGDNGLQWPVKEDGTDTQIMHTESFTRGKGKFWYWPFEETNEIKKHHAEFPLILTTGRNLEHYNAGTMTRRTANRIINDKDILLINPKDARKRDIFDNQAVKMFSARGEVQLTAHVSKQVKPGILFTTFHFPEAIVNQVTSDEADKETLCPEYKVVAVDVVAA